MSTRQGVQMLEFTRNSSWKQETQVPILSIQQQYEELSQVKFPGWGGRPECWGLRFKLQTRKHCLSSCVIGSGAEGQHISNDSTLATTFCATSGLVMWQYTQCSPDRGHLWGTMICRGRTNRLLSGMLVSMECLIAQSVSTGLCRRPRPFHGG